MALVKKCRHGRGLTGPARRREWRRCECTWLADIRVDGRREYVRLGADERVAAARYAQLVADQAAGRVLAPTSADVESVVASWVEALRAANRRPRTVEAYEGYGRLITAAFGTSDVASITGDDIAAFRAGHVQAGRAPGYVDLVVGALTQVLRHAHARGLLEVVPVERREAVRERRAPSSRQRLSLDECERIIRVMRQPWRDAGEVVLLTGLRVGELLGLTPEDVHLDAPRPFLEVYRTRGRGGLVGPPKTASSDRAVFLSPRAVELLRARVGQTRPGEWIWPGSIEGAARSAFRDARVKAGVDAPKAGWHSLRHAATALMDAAALPLRASAQALGHGAHTAMTMGYGWTAEAPDMTPVDEARARLTLRPR